jgi:anti-sigma factor RsiW
MNCRDMTDFLMAYLDGELPEAERRRFELHLGDCPPCVSYMDSYRDTLRLGRCSCEDTHAPPLPERLVQAILAARRTSSS